jgi:RNA polymerase sigma-70 factor (ECF subfamily)
MTTATDTEVEAAATTDDSHSSPALVGADRGGRTAPARAGDKKAVGKEVGRLFSEHGRLVFALCNVLLRDREDAEDATQQCFLSAQKSMLAGAVPADAAAWLAAIARNECLSRLRRRRPATVALRDDDLLTEGDVADLVDRRTEIAALSEAIAGLPPAQRQAVILRDFYGLSYREVSVALGVTGPAVESLLFKSRKRLQDRLRPFHAASGVAAVPVAIRKALGRAIPGFTSGLPRAAGGPAGAGLAAKLLSGQAAAKLAVLAVAAGAGTIAFTHGAATLFQRTSRPAAVAAAPSRAAVGPDVALAAPVTRPPDAVASPLRVTHRAHPTPVAATTSSVTPPQPPVVHRTPPEPPPRAPSAIELPKTVAGVAPLPRPVTPPVVVPEESNSFRPGSRPVITEPRPRTIPTEPTPEPAEAQDGASGGSPTLTPTLSGGPPAPAPSGPVSTDPAQGDGSTTVTTGSGSDDNTSPGAVGTDDGQSQTTTVTTTTAQAGDGDSGRHHDGDRGSSPESESDDGQTVATTTVTTTTQTTATTTTTTTSGG